MQVLGLERDDIIYPLADIVTVASLGTTLLLTLFCFCGKSSTTVMTGLMLTLRIHQASSRI